MKKALIIEIPKPCNEGWNNMKPTEKGRHCSSCERELTDFTAFSNQQLVEYFDRHTGKICGHFSSHQLNRNLVPAAASYSGLSLPALALLAVTLTATPAHGQTAPLPTTISAQKDSLSPAKPSNEQLISGRVIDKYLSEGIVFGTVTLRYQGEDIQTTTTDTEGNFSFHTEATALFDTLVVSQPQDYEDSRIPLTADMPKTGLLIYLEPVMELDGIIIIQRKEPKRAKRKRNRS